MKMKSESEVAQSCPTLRDPMDCILAGSSVHGFFSRQEYWSGVPLPSPAQAIEIPKFYGEPDRAETRPLLALLFSLTFILQTMGSHWKV